MWVDKGFGIMYYFSHTMWVDKGFGIMYYLSLIHI